ncbi:thioredoxin family protein [Pseudacidobacterium ailaaui]|jgi:peroxiredoxin|uniref:thioredoxin family protein n=1 Tax=Pseudacidobacterium ailaaui TaxID=1382359 RepID=UPI00047A4548|nr:thioredoxin family protein [Pseudacidobacterium ailaaui]MBX6358734.1 thioredoxin family protein [Pseudacidobacterium ailaaui]
MVRKSLQYTCVMAAILVSSVAAFAVRVGGPAPDFTGTDSNGKTHRLSDFRGKFVVLEWTNKDCPYTRKHYESGNMQALQREWTARGVVWLTILSSAPGHQGYMTAAEENAYLAREKASPTAAILDPTGAIGHEYEAKTTPHMFVIDPSGKIIYEGAIDDHPTTDPADIKSSKNYVSAALTEAMKGQPVAVSYTRPYGCSVKYAGGE